nr:MAG TPA: hypothetical protein [Caudoviricetes sp.]
MAQPFPPPPVGGFPRKMRLHFAWGPAEGTGVGFGCSAS